VIKELLIVGKFGKISSEKLQRLTFRSMLCYGQKRAMGLEKKWKAPQ
jgi:hypothetical protein